MPEETATPETQSTPETPSARRSVGAAGRAQILLEVNNAIVTHLNIRDLLRATSGCLHAYFRHDFAALALYDEESDSLHVHAFDRARPDTDIYEGEPVPVEGTLTGLAFTTRRAVYRSPIDAGETHAPMARRFFEQQGLQSFCCVPLVSHGRIVGVLTLGSRQLDAMTPEEVELLERISGQIAIGVENSLNFERARRESECSRLLLETNNAVVSHLDLRELVRVVFDLPVRGSLLLLYFAGMLCVLAGIGIGTFIATFTRTQTQTQLMGFFVNPPISMLSGATTPLEGMPVWMQQVSYLNPVRHFSTIARGVLLKGVGLEVLYPNLLALTAFTLVIVGASVWRFRKQLS